jgi:hypothetical protein
MTTPFTENPRMSILRNLEDECASRYSAQRTELERIIRENELLKARMEVARAKLIALAGNKFLLSPEKIKEIGESLK